MLLHYGDHFNIEGRQKATFWKSELGALQWLQWCVCFHYLHQSLALVLEFHYQSLMLKYYI